MYNRSDKLDLRDEFEELKSDLDKLSADVAHLIRKATVGQVEQKVAKRPFSIIFMAFGAGVLYGFCHRFFRCKK